MNILMLSCHAILEYDELKLFEELGHDYFSIGAYINPKKPHVDKRPALNGTFHEHMASIAMVHNQYNLHDKQVAWADVIIAMHIPEFITSNWEVFKKHKKRVVWRTIGQSVESIEAKLKPYRDEGLEIVRYSPIESRIPGYIGHDAIIRFYKDPEEFKQWTPKTDELITFSQNMKSRGAFCNYDAFHAVAQGMNAHVYGPGNEDSDLNGGQLSYEELKRKMQESGVYFYAGTHPASYTLNFMEAWMTGIPIVSVGSQLGNSADFNQDTFEVPALLQNGLFGFVSDDIEQLRIYVNQLIKDPKFAQNISRQARTEAIRIFGKDIIKKQWKEFLG